MNEMLFRFPSHLNASLALIHKIVKNTKSTTTFINAKNDVGLMFGNSQLHGLHLGDMPALYMAMWLFQYCLSLTDNSFEHDIALLIDF